MTSAIQCPFLGCVGGKQIRQCPHAATAAARAAVHAAASSAAVHAAATDPPSSGELQPDSCGGCPGCPVQVVCAQAGQAGRQACRQGLGRLRPG